jgi:hypothetical protein
MSATSFGQVLFMAWTNWGDALFGAAWKGIPLLATVWIATNLMKRTSASTRHLVWLSAMIGVLVLPIFAVTFPSWQVLPSGPHFSGFGQGTERPTVGDRHDRASEMGSFPVGVGFKENRETFGPQGFVAASKDPVDERNDANSLTTSLHLRRRSNIDAASYTWRSVVAFVWLPELQRLGSLWLVHRISKVACRHS